MTFRTNTVFTPLNDVSRFDKRTKALEQEVSRSCQSDGKAVAFFILGFSAKKESDAWSVLNAPKKAFDHRFLGF